MAKPLVLITNDDGAEAPGLQALAEAVSSRFDVLVVAPSQQQSAVGHGITLSGRWRVQRTDRHHFIVTGTPADCVYLARFWLAQCPISLVLSGVNDGFNLGTDVLYSGTVAAAAEAVVLGIPGIALSTEAGAGPKALARAAVFAESLCEWMLATAPKKEAEATGQGETPLHPPLLFNVNVPVTGPLHFRLTGLGRRTYPVPSGEWPDLSASLPDPREPEAASATAWVEVERPRVWGTEGAQGPDADAVRRGEIAITPLSVGALDAVARVPAMPQQMGKFRQVGAVRAARDVDENGFESSREGQGAVDGI